MLTALSSRLHALEKELQDTQHNFFHPSSSIQPGSYAHTRRLASHSSVLPPAVPSGTLASVWHNLHRNAVILTQFFNLLANQHLTIATPLAILPHFSNTPPIRASTYKPDTPKNMPATVAANLLYSAPSTSHINRYSSTANPTPHYNLLYSQALYVVDSNPLLPVTAQKHHATASHTNLPQPSPLVSHAGDPLHPQAVHTVPTPLLWYSNSPYQYPLEGINDNTSNSHLFGFSQPSKQSHSHVTGNPPVVIEIWNLPMEKSLCRIYNVARLDNGTLLLPKWMKTHKQAISDYCALHDVLFVIDDKSNQHKFQLDDALLGKKITKYAKGFHLNLKYANRDMFGITVPRHHMPHFVSDVVIPLMAVEVMMGSGKGVTPSLVLRPTSAKNKLEPWRNTFENLNPSLLMNKAVLDLPSSTWVSKVANFFRHPRVGFTWIPTDAKRTSSGNASYPHLPEVTVLRSVLTSNISPSEPYGLFGVNGINHVLALNGITREFPWTKREMRERPCKLSITALTRKGPRALLHLDILERRVKESFKAQGMKASFRVVDFEKMPFHDQVGVMHETNVLIATHGAGNANLVFMRPATTIIEVFPFAYKAGPFDGLANIFGLEYKTAMSAPQTKVFKECMNRHERDSFIKNEVFSKWDKAVEDEIASPWVHRLELEKEFGEPGMSQGMTTRGCVRMQKLEFNTDAVVQMAAASGKTQCNVAHARA